MKPSSRDHQLGLASPLNYTAIQSGYVESSSKRERGLDVSHHAPGPHEGRGENFFLDILFHRMLCIARAKELAKSDRLGLAQIEYAEAIFQIEENNSAVGLDGFARILKEYASEFQSAEGFALYKKIKIQRGFTLMDLSRQAEAR